MTLLPATSAQDTLARLAKGDADIALADFNELVRYRDKADAPALKAVFAFYNENGYAIIARRSRGVHSVADLQGKTIGVAEGDLAARLWPALTKRIGFDGAKVKMEKIGAAVREPMLSAGQVDGVFGLSYASAINLRDRGVPDLRPDGVSLFRFRRHVLRPVPDREPGFRFGQSAGRQRVSARDRHRHPVHHQEAVAGRGRCDEPDGRRRARPRIGTAADGAARQHRHGRGSA